MLTREKNEIIKPKIKRQMKVRNRKKNKKTKQ